MYSKKPNIVFGFHGCDEEVRDKLINNPEYFQISDKSYTDKCIKPELHKRLLHTSYPGRKHGYALTATLLK